MSAKKKTGAKREAPAERQRAKAVRRGLAKERWAHVASRQGDYDPVALTKAINAKLAENIPDAKGKAKTTAKAVPKGMPVDDTFRWVPIGPSVVRRGQATGLPRVVGRVRDIAVSPDGTRVYAASARGGVWYSGDSGSSWTPVGGWAERTGAQLGSGGFNSAQSCGAILVSFATTPTEKDVVLVGTGELSPSTFASFGNFGSVGVLAASFVAPPDIGDNVWENESGIGELQGRGTYRLVRSPASKPGSTSGADQDVVLAATNLGLARGVRTDGAVPSLTGYQWTDVTGLRQALLTPTQIAQNWPFSVTDVVWFESGRIVAAVASQGLYVSDDNGATFTQMKGCNRKFGQWIAGRITLARPYDPTATPHNSTAATGDWTTGLYALTGVRSTASANTGEGTPTLFAISVADGTVATPTVTTPGPLRADLWPNQLHYDQALWVEVIGSGHRAYVGGSFWAQGMTIDGGLWCYDVVGTHLKSVDGISTIKAGASVDGLIGTGVHPDIHCIRLTGPAGANRQVWIGCDGGVYRSGSAGKVNTFASRATGLAVLEPGFADSHPTSSHLVAAGMQDNGTQVRTGDTVWEEVFPGDGGGVLFDPSSPFRILGQYTYANWNADPKDGRFSGPTSKRVNGGFEPNDPEAKFTRAEFYSAAAAIATGTGATRVAIGTNRIWLTSNLGTSPITTWGVLPWPTTQAPAGAPVDQRPKSTSSYYSSDPRPNFGVPAGKLLLGSSGLGMPSMGMVITLRWASPTVLISLWENGVITWTEQAGKWSAAVDLQVTTLGASGTGNTVLSDVFTIPGSTDYYLTTTGDLADPTMDTCYLVTRSATAGAGPTITPTGLRNNIAGPPTPGPLDPAYAVVVDPVEVLTDTHAVYVGTVSGVWAGLHTKGQIGVTWGATPFVNGLPQAAVQDLSIHYDPASPAPRLLRAAIQSRGLWEVDLDTSSVAARTYVRVHAYDDRRRLPTPLDNPRSALASPLSAAGSPDIAVRPQAGAGIAPQWQGLPTDQWKSGNAPTYELWTFQTAFRWIYPSVEATGEWTPEFEQLVAFDRAHRQPALPAGKLIDKALWDLVVGTRITADGAISSQDSDPLAVYQPPWRRIGAMTAAATEIDLMETVCPLSELLGLLSVYDEPCTVDVLLHHRDTRPVPKGQAHALLLTRPTPLTGLGLLTVDAAAMTAYFRACATGGTVKAPPTGWQVAGPAVGQPIASLGVPLDARVPRAVSFDVDMTGTGTGFVGMLAAVWSDADKLTVDPALPAATDITDYARGWPYVAFRIIDTWPRRPSPTQ